MLFAWIASYVPSWLVTSVLLLGPRRNLPPSDAGHGQDRPALGRAYEPQAQ